METEAWTDFDVHISTKLVFVYNPNEVRISTQNYTKVKKDVKIRNFYNPVTYLTRDFGKVTKTQENITHKKAK